MVRIKKFLQVFKIGYQVPKVDDFSTFLGKIYQNGPQRNFWGHFLIDFFYFLLSKVHDLMMCEVSRQLDKLGKDGNTIYVQPKTMTFRETKSCSGQVGLYTNIFQNLQSTHTISSSQLKKNYCSFLWFIFINLDIDPVLRMNKIN